MQINCVLVAISNDPGTSQVAPSSLKMVARCDFEHKKIQPAISVCLWLPAHDDFMRLLGGKENVESSELCEAVFSAKRLRSPG